MRESNKTEGEREERKEERKKEIEHAIYLNDTFIDFLLLTGDRGYLIASHWIAITSITMHLYGKLIFDGSLVAL